MQRAPALPANRLFRGGALLVLGAAAYSSGILALTDHLSRGANLPDRRRAVRLRPDSGLLHARLAEMEEDPVLDWQRSVALEPTNAAYWQHLGSQAEISGDLPLAGAALLKAAEKSRLYQPRYLLAQYFFRREEPVQFDRWLQAALEVAPGSVTPLLDLGWRINGRMPTGNMTSRPLIARQILTFLTAHGGASMAQAIAGNLAEMGGPGDVAALLWYCTQVLADKDIEAALAVWNKLCRRRLTPYSPGVTVTNADFAQAPLAGGFDWHFEPPVGVMLSRTSGGLQITFEGIAPDGAVIAWQYVPLRKGSPLRLGQDSASEAGLRWTFFVPAEKGWRAWNGIGPAPANLARLALMYHRPSGVAPLRGTVTVSPVRLEWVP